MEEQPKTPPIERSIGSLEANLFGTLLQFHYRIVALVRDSSLDGDGKALAYERINSLIAEVETEVQSKKSIDLKGRLESVYEEAKHIVNDLNSGGRK